MPAGYDLTAAARQDVRDIWRYTAEQWGEAQADHYTGLLEGRFQQIAAGSALSRTFSARYPQVRVTRCEQHYSTLRKAHQLERWDRRISPLLEHV